MNEKVSVIIPTYNSFSTLKDAIKSIDSQTVKVKEIIVVNNASTDETENVIKKHFPKVKLVSLKKNQGVTGGRNKGIKEVSGTSDYLLFFDHDMVADKKMLSELLGQAKSSSEIGIITPKIYYWEDKKRIWAAGTDINLWTGQVLFRGGNDSGQYDKAQVVCVAPAVMLVKRDVIEKVKGFDNRYFATFEDTDFCFRALREGYLTYYAAKAIAWHKISGDPDKEAERLLDRSYWVGRNRIIFMKDFGKLYILFLVFVPIYFLYYFRMSIKYRRIRDGIRFIQGTIDGMRNI